MTAATPSDAQADEITDAMRWRYMLESERNVLGMQNLLRLLVLEAETNGFDRSRAALEKMTDRVIRSARAAGHTRI